MQLVIRVVLSVGIFFGLSLAAQDGGYLPQDVPDTEVVHPNLRVAVPNLPLVKASDESSAAVAKTAVSIVFSGSKVKCDSASQLNAVIEANAASSLRTLSEKLAGASCTTNGHVEHLDTAYRPNGAIQADAIIAPIAHGKPLLIQWNGVIYVLYGVVYDEHLHNSGRRENVIRRLLLIDPRYSDQRRFVTFDRLKDDLSRIEGIAELGLASR